MILRLMIKSFFNSNKILAITFSALMIVCLTGGLFGIDYAYCNVDYYNEYISAQREYTIYNKEMEVKQSVNDFIGKYSNRVDCMRAYFNETLSSNDIKINTLVYISQSYLDMTKAVYGKMFLEEDIKNGERKILLDSEDFDTSWIGRRVTILGIEYEVIGLFSENLIPFFSLEKTNNVEEIQIILTSPLKTALEKKEFNNELSRIFPFQRLSLPEENDVKTLLDYAPMLLPTVLLIIMGFINLSFLYVYFVKMRKQHFTIFRINGATTSKTFALFLSELFILYSAAFIVAIVAYKIVMMAFFPSVFLPSAIVAIGQMPIYDSMSFLRCVLVYGILAFVFTVSFLPSLLKMAKSDIIVSEEN